MAQSELWNTMLQHLNATRVGVYDSRAKVEIHNSKDNAENFQFTRETFHNFVSDDYSKEETRIYVPRGKLSRLNEQAPLEIFLQEEK